MRRLLLLAAAGIALSAVPAQAQYLVDGCGYGDWTVAQVTLAGREIAHVCTNERPPTPTICVPCLFQK